MEKFSVDSDYVDSYLDSVLLSRLPYSISKQGDIYVDVDNFKVKKDVFGSEFGIGVYHPDSSSKSEFELTQKIAGKDVKRAVKVLNKEQFEKTLSDLRLSLKNMTQNKSDFKIVLKGDKDVDFGVVEDLMQSLKDTRNTRFSLVTDIDAGEPDKK